MHRLLVALEHRIDLEQVLLNDCGRFIEFALASKSFKLFDDVVIFLQFHDGLAAQLDLFVRGLRRLLREHALVRELIILRLHR